MTVNFSGKILNVVLGEPLQNEDKTDMTLRNVTLNVLLSAIPDEHINGQEKAERYELAMRILKDDIVEVKAEEISEIKDLIGKMYTPLVVGQAFHMLEASANK